jgi:ubiquinone/menaquinone biosynthesis C-methylase UbiE
MMKETRVKSRLILQLNPNDNERILDFGCGTGTLTLMIKRAVSGCIVYGIDIDPEVLEIAGKKARHDDVDVHLILYNGIALPFDDGSFDKVVTSLVIHHLSRKEKTRLFGELHRVLK